ncbi:unnamed protein product, partial [marine sediment metagenome]
GEGLPWGMRKSHITSALLLGGLKGYLMNFRAEALLRRSLYHLRDYFDGTVIRALLPRQALAYRPWTLSTIYITSRFSVHYNSSRSQ